jgi:cephalosporin-C deacetylase-like acetyl esterase
VLDALQSLGYVWTRPDVNANKVFAVGWGQGGLIALTMSALRPRVAGCATIGSLATYRSLVESNRFTQPPSTFIWNVLANYDLAEAAAAIAPRPLLIAGPVDPVQKPLVPPALGQTYAVTIATYRASGTKNALMITPNEPDVAAWLTNKR